MLAYETSPHVEKPKRRKRTGLVAALSGAAILHLSLLVLIVSWKPPPMGRVARAVEVSLVRGDGHAAASPFLIASSSAPPAPPTPASAKPSMATQASPDLGASVALKPKVATDKAVEPILAIAGGPSLTAEPVSIAAQPMLSTPAASPAAGGKSCQILENLRADFQAKEEIKAALKLIPVQSRSVSNAILLWDGRWIDTSLVGGAAALQPIESAVLQTVSQAAPDCQAETLHGPRLITLGDARDTTVLAFGSGDWRWSDLIATLSPIMLK